MKIILFLTFDYKEFSIKRFSDDYMKKFWNLVQGEENTHFIDKAKINFKLFFFFSSVRDAITFKLLQNSSLFVLISLSLKSKLLNIALITGSALDIFSF